MIVRAATPADVGVITAIYNEAVQHTTASWDLEPVSLPSRQEWYRRRTGDGWPVLVAEDGGEVVGWGALGPFRDKAGYLHSAEHSVYVRLSRRGGGIGSALLTALIEEARQRRMHVLIGGVSADNAGSVAFHERHGFVRVAHFREVGRKFDRWLDLIFLQLDLDG